jgi:hypothetical protein
LDYVIRKKQPKNRDSNTSEVVVLVQWDPNKIEKIEKILWEHQALGISKINCYPYSNKLGK